MPLDLEKSEFTATAKKFCSGRYYCVYGYQRDREGEAIKKEEIPMNGGISMPLEEDVS